MYKAELDPEMTANEKIDWLAYNEGCELADGYNGLMSFLSYCCQDGLDDQVVELITDNINEHYDIVRGEYNLELEAEDDFEQRAETVAKLVLSDMIGQGLIGDQDTHSHEQWIKKIKITVENFA